MEKTQGRTRYPHAQESEKRTEPSTFQEGVRTGEPAKELSFFHDVPLRISAELGRCTITIRKLLSLNTGSILTLADEPQVHVSLRANGNEIAQGEVVTVNDHFGVRITEVKDRGEP